MDADDASKFVSALDGLIRSRTSGHGGEEFARKNMSIMAGILGKAFGALTAQPVDDPTWVGPLAGEESETGLFLVATCVPDGITVRLQDAAGGLAGELLVFHDDNGLRITVARHDESLVGPVSLEVT